MITGRSLPEAPGLGSLVRFLPPFARSHVVLGTVRIDATLPEYRRLLTWHGGPMSAGGRWRTWADSVGAWRSGCSRAKKTSATVLKMLDERRTNLIQQRTRTINQLHAVLGELLPGGATTNLTALQASTVLARVRPTTAVERARKSWP